MNGDVTIGQKPASILIVDDVAANLQVLTGMLDDQGYVTRPVTSGKMAMLAAQNDPPDLVLLDLEMPVKDGFSTLSEIRKHPRFSRVPVMAVTAKAMLLDRDRIQAAGFDAYITKPIDITKLRERVDDLLTPKGECP